MDIDRFKHINDSLGHAVGDKLLQSIAQRLVSCVRNSDTVSRQGGDEFLVLLSLIEHAEDAAISAGKMLSLLGQPYSIDSHDLHISMSIGIGIYPGDGQDAATLIKSADTAMYCAKDDGRNNYKFFEPGMHQVALERQSIEAGLRRALERDEFVLLYQPKIKLTSGAVVGVEALLRWQHPKRGLLEPAQFLSVAEDCGLILLIDRWVLRQACQQAQSWLGQGLPPISMAVNTSAIGLRARDFLDNLRATLDQTRFDPHHLELELTESVLMQEVDSTHEVLQSIANMGIQLAIDDFGTGYSSLSYLSRFPINTLKIDQSFIARMRSNPDDTAIVHAVISLGKSLHQNVIAEGVETQTQFAQLLAQHCDEGQGYYFSRPVLPEVMADLLHTGWPDGFVGPAAMENRPV
jgi:diguanylate cyclase (GGDEF)-like protein